MVTFACSSCNSSLRKNQVDSHRCGSSLSCVTCGNHFNKSNYKSHNECISEAEKSQGTDFDPNTISRKGENKQKLWIKVLSEALDNFPKSNPVMNKIITELKNRNNIPQNENKFYNFIKSLPSGRSKVNEAKLIWSHLSTYKTKLQELNAKSKEGTENKQNESKSECGKIANDFSENNDIKTSQNKKNNEVTLLKTTKKLDRPIITDFSDDSDDSDDEVEKKVSKTKEENNVNGKESKKTKSKIDENQDEIIVNQSDKKGKKKSKKNKLVNGDNAKIAIPDEMKVDEEIKVKKEKKKSKKELDNVENIIPDEMKVDEKIKVKKEKKKSKKNKLVNCDNAKIVIPDEMKVDEETKVKKEKKKSKKELDNVENIIPDEMEVDEEIKSKKEKKKSKKRKYLDNEEPEVLMKKNKVEHEIDGSEGNKVHKKSKKSVDVDQNGVSAEIKQNSVDQTLVKEKKKSSKKSF